MALYQDGILISGANTLPKMTLAEYNALPADQRPTYWERLDADYDDVLAEKSDIGNVESGTTASRAYSEGELVYVSGTLYRVKTAIASGATFTVGTNIEAKSVSDTVNAISAYDENPIPVSSGFSVQKLPANLVKISLTDYADAVTANVAKNTGKSVPSGYRPAHAGIVNCNIVNASAIVVASPRAVVDTNGNISIAACDVGGVGYAIYGIYSLK